MIVDFKKLWPFSFFNASLKLVSYENDNAWIPTLSEYRKHCFHHNAHLYEDMSEFEIQAKMVKGHKEQVEYAYQFLDLCKQDEVVYTRKRDPSHILLVTKDNKRSFHSTGYDYEFVLISVRKPPFMRQNRLECQIYSGFENPPGTQYKRDLGTFIVTDLNNKIVTVSQKSEQGNMSATFERL
jgi:hypothetical protein